jgi:hypothetical protein
MISDRAIHDDGARPDADARARWKRAVRAIAFALLLGAAAGMVTALFLSVVEAEGLVVPFAS